jgi:hypothetical protein
VGEPDVIFRKARPSHAASDHEGGRRRRDRLPDGEAPVWLGDPHESGESAGTPVGHRPAGGSPAGRWSGDPASRGPYDVDDVEHGSEPAAVGRIDLGGLQIPTMQGIEVRLQVEESSQSAVAALLVQGDSALELRALAAPRSEGLWEEIRREIATQTTRRGGIVTEATGPFGRELKVVVPTQTDAGRHATQSSRIVGVDGPRWFLCGTLIGRAATEPQLAGPLLAAMSEVVVVRGKGPMAPRDLIPLRIPESARMVSTQLHER